MIINLDDVLYISHYHESLYGMFQNRDAIDSIIKNSDFKFIVFLILLQLLECRFLELESFLEEPDANYLSSNYYGFVDWPEAEEVIRKDNNEKCWYERRTGRKI